MKSGTATLPAERTRMSNNRKLCWTEADVRCPFYLKDDRETRTLSCEGFGPGIDTVSRFRSMKLMEKHMGQYCAREFEHCPVYSCTYNCKYRDP